MSCARLGVRPAGATEGMDTDSAFEMRIIKGRKKEYTYRKTTYNIWCINTVGYPQLQLVCKMYCNPNTISSLLVRATVLGLAGQPPPCSYLGTQANGEYAITNMSLSRSPWRCLHSSYPEMKGAQLSLCAGFYGPGLERTPITSADILVVMPNCKRSWKWSPAVYLGRGANTSW